MPLTDLAIRNLRPDDRAYKRADGKGLTLLVKPDGAKLWRFRYRFGGKENMLGLGSYPEVSLSEARDRRDYFRRLLRDGVDPSAQKKAEKRRQIASRASSFGAYAEMYVEKRIAEGAAPATIKKQRTLLTVLLPDLKHRPIREIEPPELLDVLRKAERRGKRVLATEARSLAGRIFSYAIATGAATRNPALDLQGALLAPRKGTHAGVTEPARLGQLLRDIEGYGGDPVVRCALLLLAHTFVRPGELRLARWSEIDLENAMWRIPTARMKMRREHLVPLSPKAVALFSEMRETGPSAELVCGSRIRRTQPVSDMTFNKALRSLGYESDTHVAHGFRTTASTLLNEQGYPSDWIERQLAHVERNKVRGAYNAAEYLEGRTRMMKEWSEFLELL